jgi:hypothetical protein
VLLITADALLLLRRENTTRPYLPLLLLWAALFLNMRLSECVRVCVCSSDMVTMTNCVPPCKSPLLFLRQLALTGCSFKRDPVLPVSLSLHAQGSNYRHDLKSNILPKASGADIIPQLTQTEKLRFYHTTYTHMKKGHGCHGNKKEKPDQLFIFVCVCCQTWAPFCPRPPRGFFCCMICSSHTNTQWNHTKTKTHVQMNLVLTTLLSSSTLFFSHIPSCRKKEIT